MKEGLRINALFHLPTRAKAARVATVFLVVMGFQCLAAGMAEAKVYLDINAPSERSMPVAIAKPQPMGGTEPDPVVASELGEVLTNDLGFTSLLRVLDPVLYLEDSDHAGLSLGTFSFDTWELINAEALVRSGYQVNPDGGIELEFRLFDVFQKRELLARRWKGAPGQIRKMAHMFANDVVFTITGEQGIFLTSILFVQAEGAGKEIYQMDYDGGSVRRVTQNGSINLSPSWTPKRDGVVYTSYKSGVPDLYLLTFAGKETRLTADQGVDVGAEFSPDGRTLAFMRNVGGNPDIYLSDITGRILGRLTDLRGVDASPSWSPDGSRIAFVSDRYGNPQIFVMKADGSEVRRLTYDGSYNTSPAWSPRGDLIAFSSMAEGKHGISLVNPETLETRALVGEEGNNEDPSWSPDGRYVAFTSNRTGTYQIYVVDREGRREKRLTSGGNDKSAPAWSPR